MSAQDLLSLASREYILGSTSVEEQISFIEDQIADPFNSGGINYLKKLTKQVSGQHEMDEICAKFITQIQDVYSKLSIDLSDYDLHLLPLFTSIYKFFVKNISKIMYVFIREFIFNNKNRKVLVSEFLNTKIPNYPKEQFGKKEFYVLVTKLPAIIDEIFEDDIDLEKFIDYIRRNSDPMYLDKITDALDRGYITDNGVVSTMYKMYKKSDVYRADLNRLEMEINESFITPYLEENGIASVRIPPTEEITPDLDEDDREEDADED